MLKIKGIKTIDDLGNTSDTVLLRINLIGHKKVKEIKRQLIEFVGKHSVPVVAEETTTIVDEKVLTWAEIIEDYFQNEKDVYSYIFIL